MPAEVSVGSSRDPAVVYGVHGTSGTSYWKCFARGSILHSDLEAWEYAALEPGATSGEHRHTRTDEVYFILAGEGEVLLSGERHPVGAGDAILTPLGAVHGLTNSGESLLEWLTIEVTHPETIERLPAWSPIGVVETAA